WLALTDLRLAKALEGYPPLAFDAGLKHYVRSDSRGNLCVRQVSGDQEIVRLPGLGTHAYHLRFSPDGQFLAAIYHQQQPALFVWDWRRGQAVLKTGLFGGTDFSPDSRRLVLGDQGSIRFYDLASGKEEKRLALGPGGHQFAFDPKGRRLAVTGGSQANVQIYDLPTDKIVQTFTCPA